MKNLRPQDKAPGLLGLPGCVQSSEVRRSLLINKNKRKRRVPQGGFTFSLPQLLSFFGDLKLYAKFQKPRKTSSGRKECGGEKRKIMPNIVDTFFSSRTEHRLHLDQN